MYYVMYVCVLYQIKDDKIDGGFVRNVVEQILPDGYHLSNLSSIPGIPVYPQNNKVCVCVCVCVCVWCVYVCVCVHVCINQTRDITNSHMHLYITFPLVK